MRPGLGVLALLLVVAAAHAQFEGRFDRYSRVAPRLPDTEHPDTSFAFCRLMYTSVRREPAGSGWRTDYPYADINFMVRLSELTKTSVSRDDEGEPQHWVVRASDPALFNCPFVMASDVGTVGFSDEEAKGLRDYLLKGGFLWVDDFWGSLAWDHWRQEIAKALPPAEYPIIEVPVDHPVFKTMYNIHEVPQITNIGFWRSVAGLTTSERGADSREARLLTISDRRGRVMVIMSHNTDVADSWEREGEDVEFFHQFSPDGYALGINIILYAMTH